MNIFPGISTSNSSNQSVSRNLNADILSERNRKTLWFILLAILAIRLLSLGLYPLQDTSEARYGEIARIMFETQNWVTPQFNYNIPFWGKPPLATWLSAGSFELLGVTEFAARLPSFILMLFVLSFTYVLVSRQKNSSLALVSTFILASSTLFFIIAGAVLMDAALLLGVTLSMVAFWLAMKKEHLIWGYAFFIGLSIGLLSKGPLVLVLVGTPIGFWIILQNNYKQVFNNIPWFSGGMLMLLISLPWYFLAEQRTPGFIDYFIIGEHWNRFMVSGWQGDLYGSAHAKARGTIWVYALVSFLPWSFLLLFSLWKVKSNLKKLNIKAHSWLLYLCLWALTPLLFFSFSGNILATYALTAMVPLAIITADCWLHLNQKNTFNKGFKTLIGFGLVIPLVFITAISLQKQGTIKAKSQKTLIEAFHHLNKTQENRLIYVFKRPFSARFYSQGKALEVQKIEQLTPYFQDNIIDYFAIQQSQLKNVPEKILLKLNLVSDHHSYSLFKEIKKP